MIRPMTCLSLLAALGAGLYLYQEKHTAQMLDRDITRTVKQADQARDRIGLLKAEWALLNEPERLQGLAAQHLQLQIAAAGAVRAAGGPAGPPAGALRAWRDAPPWTMRRSPRCSLPRRRSPARRRDAGAGGAVAAPGAGAAG